MIGKLVTVTAGVAVGVVIGYRGRKAIDRLATRVGNGLTGLAEAGHRYQTNLHEVVQDALRRFPDLRRSDESAVEPLTPETAVTSNGKL